VQFVVCRLTFCLTSFLVVYCVFVIVHCEVRVVALFNVCTEARGETDGYIGGGGERVQIQL